MRELPIPPAAKQDSQARELLRLWAAGGSQHVVVDAMAWGDPAAWGIALVDLARHIARAYESSSRANLGDEGALKRILAGFDAELHHQTDEPTGGLGDR